MKRTIISIPTKGRANFQIQKTLRQFIMFAPQHVRDVVLVVDPEEADAYRDEIPHDKIGGIVVADGKLGISAKREWILRNLGPTCQTLFMIDDDIQFFHRINKDEGYLRKVDTVGRNLDEAVDFFVAAMLGEHRYEGYPNIVFSGWGPRLHNDKYGPIRWNRHIGCAFGFRPDVLLAEEFSFNDVLFFQDKHLSLFILERGYNSLMSSVYAHEFGKWNAPGGCSTYRTPENHRESAMRLQELHPDVVSLKYDGYGLGVWIQWKKAFGTRIAERKWRSNETETGLQTGDRSEAIG